jgi:GTPase SAR1 family protein
VSQGAPYKREIEALRKALGDDRLCALIRMQVPSSQGLSKHLDLHQRERFLDTICQQEEARILTVAELHPYLRRRQTEGLALPLTASRWPSSGAPRVVPSPDRTTPADPGSLAPPAGPVQLPLLGEETPKPMRRRNILISGPVNAGKTTLALEYGRYMRGIGDGDVLSIDYEGLQSAFHTDDETLEDPDTGAYFFTRLVTPTLYEIRALAAKLAAPTVPGKELLVAGRPIDTSQLRAPTVAVLRDINGGRRYGTVVIDTVTRLADDLVAGVFADKLAAAGGNYETIEKMRQPIYGACRKEMEDLLQQLVSSDAHLVLTAWSKGKWNQARRTTTDEQIVDISGVQRSVETYMELVLMLVKKQNDQGHTVYPSDAILLKSKIKGLPEGAMIEALDWDTIFAAEPVLTRPPDYDAQVNGNGNGTPNGVPREEDGHDEEEAVTLVEEETPFAPGDGD